MRVPLGNNRDLPHKPHKLRRGGDDRVGERTKSGWEGRQKTAETFRFVLQEQVDFPKQQKILIKTPRVFIPAEDQCAERGHGWKTPQLDAGRSQQTNNGVPWTRVFHSRGRSHYSHRPASPPQNGERPVEGKNEGRPRWLVNEGMHIQAQNISHISQCFQDVLEPVH